MPDVLTMSSSELRAVMADLYPGMDCHAGRRFNEEAPTARQMLEAGLPVPRRTLTSWLDPSDERSPPPHTAVFLRAAQRTAAALDLASRPLGTRIADRMADLVSGRH